MSTPRATPRSNGYDSAGYFPTQHSQPTHHPNSVDADTLANTQAEYNGPLGPTTMHPAKFTEEWDASQRGSSIIDSPGPGAMQRSVSYTGNTGGGAVDGASLSRGNTLRKKASVRRSASLKRSGSRRSMKAGSVRSLALQPTTDEDGMHSAFFCPVPTTANPTEALANRFQGLSLLVPHRPHPCLAVMMAADLSCCEQPGARPSKTSLPILGKSRHTTSTVQNR